MAKSHETAARQLAVPAAPISSSVLRPSLSITLMPTMVKTRLVKPMAMACWSPEIWLKPGCGEDVVQVIEDGVDARQLVECADGDGQKQRIAVLPLEDRLVGRGVLLGQRGANVGQLGLRGLGRPSA